MCVHPEFHGTFHGCHERSPSDKSSSITSKGAPLLDENQLVILEPTPSPYPPPPSRHSRWEAAASCFPETHPYPLLLILSGWLPEKQPSLLIHPRTLPETQPSLVIHRRLARGPAAFHTLFVGSVFNRRRGLAQGAARLFRILTELIIPELTELICSRK